MKPFDERIKIDHDAILADLQTMYDDGQLSKERYVGLYAIVEYGVSGFVSYTKWNGERWNLVQIFPESLHHHFTVDDERLVFIPTNKHGVPGIESMPCNPDHHRGITVRGLFVKQSDATVATEILA